MPCIGIEEATIPRNGSNVYSLPGTYLAVTGETIEAQQHNDPLEDLESDANNARPVVVGGTGATTAADARTNLAVPGLASDNTMSGANSFTGINTFTKIQKWAKGADVASATALTLGDDGNYFDITGTTTITSITTKGAGTVVKLHFDAALTLTYHATDLILPGAVNITTAAGDEAEFVEYATGDWRCLNYQRAAAKADSVAPPSASYKNLSIKVTGNTGATLNADYITVTDGTNFQTLAFSSKAIDFSTTGAGALDAGTVASATWYAIWGIAKTDGTTSAIASTSATAPTMPSGYTYKARVGWVRTASGSAQLLGTWQFGNRARYVLGLAQTSTIITVVTGNSGNPTTPTFTTATASSYVPTTASVITLIAAANGNSASVIAAPNSGYGGNTDIATKAPPLNVTIGFTGYGTQGSGLTTSIIADLLLESSSFYVASAGSTGTYAGVMGWVDNI